MPYLGLIYLVVLVAALIDIIATDDAAVRGLPKFGWVLLVVVIPLVGALLWLVIGRRLRCSQRVVRGAGADQHLHRRCL